MPGDIELRDVRAFWEKNPVAAAAVPYEPGSSDFYDRYDLLRELNEPLAFSHRLHEYSAHSGRRVLDVGCGNGYVLERYAAEGAHAFGVDLTERAIGLSRRRFQLRGVRGELVLGSAEDLPFPDQAFDCVCSMGVLHHTPDTARAVREIWRVMRPGGRLIMMLYHRNSALYRALQFRSLRSHRPIQEVVNEVDGVGNPKGAVYSRKELRKLLRSFEEIEIFAGLLRGPRILGSHRFPPTRLLRPFEPRWGWFLYAKARRST